MSDTPDDKSLPIFIPVDIDGPLGHLDMIVVWDASTPEVEEKNKAQLCCSSCGSTEPWHLNYVRKHGLCVI